MKLLRENLALKVASLALAIGVWFVVRGEDRPVQIVSVPLEIRNLPDDLAIAGDVIDSVNVRVKAPEVVLNTMKPDRISARLDLASLESGDHMVRLRPEEVRVPPGADVVKISPEYVAVRLERRMTRELPVTPRVIGEPAEGYAIGTAIVKPDHVRVSGPESAMRLAKEVLTDVVRVDGRATPVEMMVNLFPDRMGVRVVSDERATLTADIHEQQVMRVFEGVPVRAEGTTALVRLDPATVDITLEGTPGAFAGVARDDLSVFVDLSRLALKPGGYRLKPRVVFRDVSLASRFSVKRTSVEEISVQVLGAGPAR